MALTSSLKDVMVYHKLASVLPSCSGITSLFVDGLEVLVFIIRILEKHHCQSMCLPIVTLIIIDEARQKLFTMKGQSMDAIPPTRAALLQHIKRAVYQGGHSWGKVLQATIGMPPPGDWGWVNPQNWRPMWTIYMRLVLLQGN